MRNIFKRRDKKNPMYLHHEWLENLDRALVSVENRVHAIENSGVATAINKLNREVFKDRKEMEAGIFGHFDVNKYALTGGASESTPEVFQDPTLAGKVEAIIKHLSLEFDITPKKVKNSEVVAKRVNNKKKGRK